MKLVVMKCKFATFISNKLGCTLTENTSMLWVWGKHGSAEKYSIIINIILSIHEMQIGKFWLCQALTYQNALRQLNHDCACDQYQLH